MDAFTTQAHSKTFSIDFCVKHLDAFDNAEALGQRLCLLYIGKGSGLAKVNDGVVPFISPCVFCINEKEHVVIEKECGCELRALYFHPSVINNIFDFETVRVLPEDVSFTVQHDSYMMHTFLERNEANRGMYIVGPSTGKHILSLMDTFEMLITKQQINWPCRSRSYVMELLFMLDGLGNAAGAGEALTDEVDEDFLPLLQYIYSNYDKKITVEELTEQFHISKSTIAKKFKNNLGDSFLVYLNKLRIRMAATMLRDTALPVNEIMYRVGFMDTVHFLRTFKKYMNETPSSYREKYNWM